MSYLRVIPRDLFNESKLLKCLGALYIASEYQPEGKVVLAHDGNPFVIQQDPSDGSIFVANLRTYVNAVKVHLYTPLNSRKPYPLCFDYADQTDYVFADDGGLTLTASFLRIGEPTCEAAF